MSKRPARAVIVTRLSREVENSTSIERQEQYCREKCEAEGWEVIGVARDVNVSAGGRSPWQRAGLSEWIGKHKGDPGRSREFDVLVFWRMDRLVRSVTQLWELLIWAGENGVTLVSATEQMFDTTKAEGKLMVSMVGAFAELELEAIRERTRADQRHRINSGHYRGSVPPWGYRPVQNEQGNWVLEPDPEQTKTIDRVVHALLHENKSVTKVCKELNADGVPTVRDLNHKRNGRPMQGLYWSTSALTRMLKKPTLLGLVTTQDEILDAHNRPARDARGSRTYENEHLVLGPDNRPLQRAEPVMSREDFDAIQKLLSTRGEGTGIPGVGDSLLLGVLFCGVCGRKAYLYKREKQGRQNVYRCQTVTSTVPVCSDKQITVNAGWIEGVVTDTFLGLFGDSVRTVRVWQEGNDVSTEIAELHDSMDAVAGVLARQRPGSAAFDSLATQIEEIQARLDELEQVETVPSGWRWVPTDQTVAQWWENASNKERNKYLIESGVHVEFEHTGARQRGIKPKVRITFEDYAGILEQLTPGIPATRVADALAEVPEGTTVHIDNAGAHLGARE